VHIVWRSMLWYLKEKHDCVGQNVKNIFHQWLINVICFFAYNAYILPLFSKTRFTSRDIFVIFFAIILILLHFVAFVCLPRHFVELTTFRLLFFWPHYFTATTIYQMSTAATRQMWRKKTIRLKITHTHTYTR